MSNKKRKAYTEQEEKLLDTFFTWYNFVRSGLDENLDDLARSYSAADGANVFLCVLEDIGRQFGADYAIKLEEALDLLAMRSFIMGFKAAYEVDIIRRPRK